MGLLEPGQLEKSLPIRALLENKGYVVTFFSKLKTHQSARWSKETLPFVDWLVSILNFAHLSRVLV